MHGSRRQQPHIIWLTDIIHQAVDVIGQRHNALQLILNRHNDIETAIYGLHSPTGHLTRQFRVYTPSGAFDESILYIGNRECQLATDFPAIYSLSYVHYIVKVNIFCYI